jgi:CheY-like chemotaxis protein
MTIPSPPRSVLVVDDVPDMSTSLGLLLAGLGFSVRTAQSGEQALCLIRDDPPDAVISHI